jgi:transcriptional regulator with XRE-family HTH domain
MARFLRKEKRESSQYVDEIANPLADRYPLRVGDDLAARLARNIRQLREMRGFTQQQMAKLSGIPRATWGHLESGGANPTLAVLDRVATALQVPIEELTAAPRSSGRLYPKDALVSRKQGDGIVRKLLPDPIPGMLIDRMEIPAGGQIIGVPHMPGTREYLTCESGTISLAAGGERWRLSPGDVVVFRGDQRHSYANPGQRAAVGYSVVILTRRSSA